MLESLPTAGHLFHMTHSTMLLESGLGGNISTKDIGKHNKWDLPLTTPIPLKASCYTFTNTTLVWPQSETNASVSNML